ncbi:MAG: hypothetical protein QXD03_02230 [Candidatus Anstonellales archaeon]
MMEITRLLQVSTFISTVDTPVSQIRKENNKLISNSKFFDLKNKSINCNRMSIKLDYINNTFQPKSIFYNRKVSFFYLNSNYPVKIVYNSYDFQTGSTLSVEIITSMFSFNNAVDYLVSLSIQGLDYRIYNPEFDTIIIDYAFVDIGS